MSQTDTDKAVVAEERTEEARSFVRRVRTATRRRYSAEEKIRIVLEGFRRETPVNDLCRREGIKPHSYYAWTKEFMEDGKERLPRDTVRDATRQEGHQLRRENEELKRLVGSCGRDQRPSLMVPWNQTQHDAGLIDAAIEARKLRLGLATRDYTRRY